MVAQDQSRTAWLRDRLGHVYWIGGGSGSGKSTIASRVANTFHLDIYATDEVMGDHVRRCTTENAPYLKQFAAMDMDERWVNRSPETMLETFHWYRGEGFELIVEDLLALPPKSGFVAEGSGCCRAMLRRSSPIADVRSGCCRLRSFAEQPSRAGASCGSSPVGRATQNAHCKPPGSGPAFHAAPRYGRDITGVAGHPRRPSHDGGRTRRARRRCTRPLIVGQWRRPFIRATDVNSFDIAPTPVAISPHAAGGNLGR
jgi:hypothetical protein